MLRTDWHLDRPSYIQYRIIGKSRACRPEIRLPYYLLEATPFNTIRVRIVGRVPIGWKAGATFMLHNLHWTRPLPDGYLAGVGTDPELSRDMG